MKSFNTTAAGFLSFVLFLTSLLSGCASTGEHAKLDGTWVASFAFTNPEVLQADGPVAEGTIKQMQFEGRQVFDQRGNSETEGTFEILVQTASGELNLRLRYADRGQWRLRAKATELVETTTGGKLTALDQTTKDYLRQHSELKAAMTPTPGEIHVMKLRFLADNEIEVTDEEGELIIKMKKVPGTSVQE